MTQATDLVTLADVADELNWSDTQQAKYASEVARYITAATSAIEDIVGPVVQRDVDEWHNGGDSVIQLWLSPVVSVNLVEETYGGIFRTLVLEPPDQPGDYYGYIFESDTGLLIRRMQGQTGSFLEGLRNVHVQYTAGQAVDTASVPANISAAALEIIRVNWRPQQGGNRPSSARPGGADESGSGGDRTGRFVPPQVYAILGVDFEQMGGFA